MSRGSEAVKKWRERTKSRLVESMGGKCVCCGYNRCNDALQFHHLKPEDKGFSFGGARANIISWDRIVKEIKKCVMICSNCHFEIHCGFTVVPENACRFNEDYEDYKRDKIIETDICPICNGEKPTYLITCSRVCAAKRAFKVDWSNINLQEMLITLSPNRIADNIGVSNMAVRKRMKKLGIIYCKEKKTYSPVV